MARYLVRIVLLRAMAFVLCTAFLIAYQQWRPLLGDQGLTPVNTFLDRVVGNRRHDDGCSPVDFFNGAFGNLDESTGSRECLTFETFQKVPTYLWFVPRSSVDAAAESGALIGLLLSVMVFVTGACAAPVMLLLWALYLSLISVGQDWYSFGWESQLCETTFLIVFACPLWWKRFPNHDLPVGTTYLLRWLLLRIMLGAGLIKLRGDECWRDLSCMRYHYHSQPVPNPLSPYFHALPDWVHTAEVAVNHFVECVVPFFLWLPQPAAAIGGLIQLAFQAILISSGNLSLLNWLTMVPAIAAFDDGHVRWLFGKQTVDIANRLAAIKPPRLAFSTALRNLVQLGVVCLIAFLSAPVITNLLSPRQAMNTSFDWLRLVNTHGNFGSVTRGRNEVIFEGKAVNGTWFEYEFNCKPGDINRRPCVISPYHYRLDWLMWFAAFSDPQRTGWLLHLSHLMLDARTNPRAAETLNALIARSPFGNQSSALDGPIAIRAALYEYEFRKSGKGGRRDILNGKKVQSGDWWVRRKLDKPYLPELTAADLVHVHKFYRLGKTFR